jgi:hypothetical protein
MPAVLLKVIAQWRNRIEASFGEITEQMGLTRHALIPSAGCSPEPQQPSPPTP